MGMSRRCIQHGKFRNHPPYEFPLGLAICIDRLKTGPPFL
jgi:hypothetical protein